MYAGVLEDISWTCLSTVLSQFLCVFVNECLTVDAHYNILFIYELIRYFFLY